MKANQFVKDQEAQVGIGTMVVFIATILVAAIAAGVLINVGGDLQGQSKSTAADARDEVSNSLRIMRVYARDVTTDLAADDVEARDTGTTDDEADELHIFVALAAGSVAADLANFQVILETEGGVATFTYFNHGPGETTNTATGETPGAELPPNVGSYYFALEEQGVADRSANTEITGSDLFNIRLLGQLQTGNTFGDRLDIGAGEKARVTIVPETGSSLFMDLEMPSVMDTDYEQLY